MAKGGYTGGSTVFGRGSDWFSYRPPKKKPAQPAQSSADPRPINVRIAEAADRLAAAKAEYDRGEWTAEKMPAKVKRSKPKPKQKPK
jgi:hypothetical protein